MDMQDYRERTRKSLEGYYAKNKAQIASPRYCRECNQVVSRVIKAKTKYSDRLINLPCGHEV